MNHFSFRRFLLLSATAIFIASVCMALFANTQEIKSASLQERFAALEASCDGRLGISAINTANNVRIEYRADERFPFCSTFKVMGVSAILKQSMTIHRLLQQVVKYKKEDLASYSPITKNHVLDGMTIDELCAAAIRYSDNTAINLLVKELGGPETVNDFARFIGNDSFRLERLEPELNTAIPGDIRDTSTPAAMAKSLQKLALGDTLTFPQREQLQIWLKKSNAGNSRIRAGVPKDWAVGNKSGTGDYGTTNDIGIIWPPNCPPIVVAIFFTQNKKDAVPRDDVIVSATRILMSEFAHTDSDQCIKSLSGPSVTERSTSRHLVT